MGFEVIKMTWACKHSIFIFTFYIINQVSIFNFHITWLVLRIFSIKSDITEVSEEPEYHISALNVSKQTTLVAGVDVAPPDGAAYIT